MKKISAKSKDNIYLVLNLVLAVVTMALVLSLTGRIMAQDIGHISLFLALSIGSLVLYQGLVFAVQKRKRDRIRVVIVGFIYIGAAITGYLVMNHYIFCYLSAFLVVVAMALNQFLLIEKEETKKGMITNILLGITLSALGVAILISISEENAFNISIVTVILLLFGSLKRLVFPSFRIEKIRLLLNILIKTHTFDVLICLVAFMIAFSFLFPMVEPNITTFWDAMWYCFTVITTIGFGDFYASSVIGRIMTVILGIYGIVVVAILTSVIVNFYNEVSAKEKAKDRIE